MYRFESRDGLPAEAPDSDAAVYAGRATRLNLPFAKTVRLSPGSRATVAAIQRGVFAMSADGTAYLAPGELELASIAGWLAAHPTARQRLWVTTPQAIRAALTDIVAADLIDKATNGLSTRRPEFSARRTLTGGQIVVATVVTALLLAGFLLARESTVFALNFAAAVLFFSVSALRFIAAALVNRRVPAERATTASDESEMPEYTVLVPLHREADLVGDLVRVLCRLDWPREKLDVKLLLEEGDEATIRAVHRAVRGTPFEVVVVPAGAPRTKPRALAYALPLARGVLVTVYDAEDRPHPAQLRRVWETFRRGHADLACVQAALVVDNSDQGWLPLLFAIEYAALFDGLLPALAELGMPVPLGGTSNHFYRRVLEDIGGWDCYNVTEDADVGIRLARFGYRTAIIDSPTLEDAPVDAGAWFRQRTRWFKGWLQTTLVHTRHPLRLFRDVGPAGATGFLLTSAGMIVSAMVYPVYLATVIAALVNPLALWGDGDAFHAAAIGIYLFNLIAGHTAMALLSLRALDKRGREGLAVGVFLLPFYWLFMSFAAYRAIGELVLRPHHWAKTPHRRHRRTSDGILRRRETPPMPRPMPVRGV